MRGLHSATDWLRSMGLEEERDEPGGLPSDDLELGSDSVQGIDWLRNVKPEDLPANLEAFDFDPSRAAGAPSAAEPDIDSLDVPDWLRSDEPAESGDVNDDAMPTWMQSTAQPPAPPPSRSDDPTVAGRGAPRPPLDSANNVSAPSNSGVPDWLVTDDAPAPPPTQPDTLSQWSIENDVPPLPSAPPADTDSIPDWLRSDDLPDIPDMPDAGAPPPMPPADTDSIPDWLREESNPALPASEPPASGDASIPDWLVGDEAPVAFRMPDDQPLSAVPPFPSPDTPDSPDDMPAWMRSADAPAAPDAPTAPASDDIPDWLQSDALGAVPSGDADAPAMPTLPPFPSPDSPDTPDTPDDMPAWMRPDAPDASVPPPPGADSPDSPDDTPAWMRPDPLAEGNDLPPWMRDEPDSPPMPDSSGDLPAWMRGDQQATPALPAATAPSDSGEPTDSGIVAGVDLPHWLREPEQPVAATASASDERVSWLSSLNLQNDEADVAIADDTARATFVLPRPSYTLTADQHESVRLLTSLAVNPFPASQPLPHESTPTFWQQYGTRILYGILALLILFGVLFAAPLNRLGVTTTAPNQANVAAVADVLQTLPAEAVVLVAYEWDARRISELALLEEATLANLIAQEAGFISMSTDPQGTILSFDMRDQLQAAGYQGGGIDYILLGYKPGQELALRLLANDFPSALRSDFAGRDATESLLAGDETGELRLRTLNDLGMLLIMADQPQDVQRWMEQVYPTLDAQAVPVVFLLPAEVTPVVRPYLEQPGVYYLSGKRDALALVNQSGAATADTALATTSDASLTMAIIAFVLLLGVGLLLNRQQHPKA